MRQREIGSSGIQASVVGLGTWAIGGGPWWGETDDAQSVRTIQEALDHGINLIDTAPGYGYGRSEEVVARAIRGRRGQVVISTKCGLWWKDDRGVPFFAQGDYDVRRCLRPETIREELETSLMRLDTDYVDVYFTHWQSVEPDFTPIAETAECLAKLKEQGKIRAIGASNADVAQLAEYAAVCGLDAGQPKYSMLDRAIEADVLPYCREHNVSVFAYSPLEQGLLTGKIGMDAAFGKGEYRNEIPWFKPENRRRVLDMLEGWRDLTETYACTMAQLVIAWTVGQPGVTHALCGARKPGQIRDNAGAGALVLSGEDMERMRRDVKALGKPV